MPPPLRQLLGRHPQRLLHRLLPSHPHIALSCNHHLRDTVASGPSPVSIEHEFYHGLIARQAASLHRLVGSTAFSQRLGRLRTMKCKVLIFTYLISISLRESPYCIPLSEWESIGPSKAFPDRLPERSTLECVTIMALCTVTRSGRWSQSIALQFFLHGHSRLG